MHRRVTARRRGWRLMHVQAVLWSAGNALTAGAPIYYLAQELGGGNRHVGLLLALPMLFGLLRLHTPAVIQRLGGAKQACLAALVLSYGAALILPPLALTIPGGVVPPLALLVGVICIHQTLEYIGLTALLSWLSALVPARIRGRYLGARLFWQLAVEIPFGILGGRAIDLGRTLSPARPWLGYAAPLALGVVCLLLSLVPLALVPPPRALPTARPWSWQQFWRPFQDPCFRRLLLFGCWFSLFNGLTGAPQRSYPYAVLKLPLMPLAAMNATMRLGQFALSRPLGAWCDRIGTRPVLLLSQWLVASGPIFFILATPRAPYWLIGAYLVWSMYVGMNVGLPNLMFKLAPRGENSAYIGTYFGVTGVANALAVIAGGQLFDLLLARLGDGPIAGPFDLYQLAFLFAWITRTLGVLLLSDVPEPGARQWRHGLRRSD